jgi:hypothetical protein
VLPKSQIEGKLENAAAVNFPPLPPVALCEPTTTQMQWSLVSCLTSVDPTNQNSLRLRIRRQIVSLAVIPQQRRVSRPSEMHAANYCYPRRTCVYLSPKAAPFFGARHERGERQTVQHWTGRCSPQTGVNTMKPFWRNKSGLASRWIKLYVVKFWFLMQHKRIDFIMMQACTLECQSFCTLSRCHFIISTFAQIQFIILPRL